MKPFLCLIVLLLPVTAVAQENNPFNFPSDLLGFWVRYTEAKLEDDEEGMESAVRRDRRASEDCLDWILDGLSREEDYERQSEARELAWTMDAVERSERYIERVRYVIDLELKQRKLRSAALARWTKALAAEEEAKRVDNPEVWAAATGAYLDALKGLQGVNDYEFQMYCLNRLEQVEAKRGRDGHRAKFLEQLIEAGNQLAYEDPTVAYAEAALAELKLKAEKAGQTELTLEKDKGHSLNDFAEGSEWTSIPTKLVVPKKGLAGLDLPTFAPFEQYLLWPWTEVAGEGPADFDSHRGPVLQPHRTRWQLGRDGIAKFTLDVDGDFETDLEFTPTTTPQMIEVPDPDGGDPFPLWVCVGSQREAMFSVEANHAPSEAVAQLRFFPGYWLEADVLGDTWRIFDLNQDGQFGMHTEFWDDYISYATETEGVEYGEVDAVLVGKAKKGLPLSMVVDVDGTWYRTEVTRQEVRVRELNLATGTLEVDIDLGTPLDFLVAAAVNEEMVGAYFDILPTKKGRPITLPVGEYKILQGRMSSGKKTGMDIIRVYTGSSEPIKIYEDTPTKIELGAPFKLTFKVEQAGEDFIIKSETVRIFGRYGEEYGRLFDDPLAPVISLQNADGKMIEKAIKSRRPNISDWERQGDKVLYFPLRHSMVNITGEAWQAKMVQKSHKLLGGPLESDWIGAN